MLDINYLRTNTETAKKRLAKRNKFDIQIIDTVLLLDDDRKKIQTDLDNTLAEINSISKEIGKMMGQGKTEEAEAMKIMIADLKIKTSSLEDTHTSTTEKIKEILLTLPNLPQEIVPAGLNPEENVEIKKGGDVPQFNFEPVPHWELTTTYNLIDFELGNKITGSGFPVYIGKGAKLLWL